MGIHHEGSTACWVFVSFLKLTVGLHTHQTVFEKSPSNLVLPTVIMRFSILLVLVSVSMLFSPSAFMCLDDIL